MKTKLNISQKPEKLSAIELHLKQAEHRDNLRKKIEKIETEIFRLVSKKQIFLDELS